MDTLKEQILLRKLALNPDLAKKGNNENASVNLAKQSNFISKFGAMSEEDEESDGSDS